ncbi:MAG: hypothetical protein KC503_32695 [Myxococcales bacterium]|nr:hypothetical protein [Myxococcales bacterium]
MARVVRVVVLLCVCALWPLWPSCNSGDVGNSGSDGPGSGGDGLTFTDGGDSASGRLVITPANATITVKSGQPLPTLQYKAKLDDVDVTAQWTLDRGELGTLTTAGLLTASGDVAGVGKVTASAGGIEASTQVTIKIETTQNGATTQNGNPGPGGFGGVGGEGLGPAADAAVVAVLNSTPQADASMKMLYPYDATVWPLGVLAPLMQWNSVPGGGNGDGVRIELSSDHYSFVGTFGRPTALAANAPLVRHPIPQDVWKAATRSAAGGKLTVKVIVASGGTAYGPLSETWTIATSGLRGTVYYQSYGTKLAKNYSGAKGGDGRFGGATLAIKGGSSDPVLVAGQSSSDHSGCRVCHSVAADGGRMIVQHGTNYARSSSYDLLGGYAESVYAASTDGKLGWIGMTPDGKLGLGNAAPIPGNANTGDTALYDMTNGDVVQTTGLTAFVTRAGFPMFSADGKRVAFNLIGGPGDTATGAGDGTQLVVMDFDRTNNAFSNPKLLYKGTADKRPGWPAFWPTGDALLFQREIAANPGGEFFATRNGARAELWWVDLASATAQPLHALNGRNAGGTALTIPTGPNNHDDDATLNYEPTVSPIASGGYAWVVFVSRRLYGNVATIDPWASDPRDHDLTQTATTKKLWIAALDLNAKPGTDPSHPPFYLPGQELFAGNSRGFWVADPCKADGESCEGGDECCGGFCSRVGNGPLQCGSVKIGCAKEFDKCTDSAECCDYPKYQCVNGRCAHVVIN